MNKATLIAYYLPQYYPTEHNNEWWGKGFTEWTNVTKAKKLFPGHYQPKIPSELGFYDLRMKEIRQQQADLAKKHGIDAFCFYYYRFSKNQHELDFPIKEILRLKEPDFPYMFCWANHDWSEKHWNSDKAFTKKILLKQVYGDEEDIVDFFYEMLPYFKDERYLKIENKPLYTIYKPLDVPNLELFIKIWNNLAKANGLNGISFIAYSEEIKKEENKLSKYDFYAINSCKLHAIRHNHSQLHRYINALFRKIFKLPYIVTYKKAMKDFVGDDEKKEKNCPTIIPNWDHSPRSGTYGYIITKSSPKLFSQHLNSVFDIIKNKQNKIIFIKSWNEWGEGNYLEPDLKWGRQYLESLKIKRDEFNI